MAYKPYAEKLKDPRWREKSQHIKQSAGMKCRQCACEDGLEVHHAVYIRGIEPWDYDDGMLICLCRDCHFTRQVEEEAAKAEFAFAIARFDTWELREIGKSIAYALDKAENSGYSQRAAYDVLCSRIERALRK